MADQTPPTGVPLLGYGLGNYLGVATGWLCQLMA